MNPEANPSPTAGSGPGGRDQQHVAERRLRALIADGLESGDGRPATADVIDEIRQRAFAADT
jgi:hypothetical protein